MKSTQDIENDLNRISEILQYSKKLTFDSYSMLVAKTNAKHNVIWGDKFLKRTRDSLWLLAMIELAKLFGQSKQNDHFSIPIFISELRKFHLTSKWKHLITSAELKQCSIQFKNAEIRTRIDKLKELRNQHLAHTDKNPDNNIYNVKFYFEDSMYLIEQAEEIITYLSSKLLPSPIEFQEYKGEDVDSFLDKHITYAELAGKYNMIKLS